MLRRCVLLAVIFSTRAMAVDTVAGSGCGRSLAEVLSAELVRSGLLPANGLPLIGNVVDVPRDPMFGARAYALGASGTFGKGPGLRMTGDTDWVVADAGSTEPFVFSHGQSPATFARLVAETLTAISRRAFDRHDPPPHAHPPENVRVERVDGGGLARIDRETGETLFVVFPDPTDPEVEHWVIPAPEGVLVRGPDFRVVASDIVVTVRGGNPAEFSGEVIRVAPLRRDFASSARPAILGDRFRRLGHDGRAEARERIRNALREKREQLQKVEAQLRKPPPAFPRGPALVATSGFAAMTGAVYHAGLPLTGAFLLATSFHFFHAIGSLALEASHPLASPWIRLGLWLEAASMQRKVEELRASYHQDRQKLREELETLQIELAHWDAMARNLQREREARFALESGARSADFVPYRPDDPEFATSWNALEPSWTAAERHLFTLAFRRAERLYLVATERERFLALVRTLASDVPEPERQRQGFDAFLRPFEVVQFPAPMTLREFATSRPAGSGPTR